MLAWNAIGEHRYRTEDDLLHWVNGPEHSAEEIVALCSQAYALFLRYGYALILVDCTRGGHVSATGRKAVIEYVRSHRAIRTATAVIGASAPTRVAGQLIIRALTALKIQSASRPLAFLIDEAAAHRWLAEQRPNFLIDSKEPG
jgi:hypothetical protein